MVSMIESKYCLELAFSCRGFISGKSEKSGAKYSKYSVLNGNSADRSCSVQIAVSYVQHLATFLIT